MGKIAICFLACLIIQSTYGSSLVPSGAINVGDVRYEYGIDTANPDGGDGYLWIHSESGDRLVVFDEGGKEEVVFVADLGLHRVGVVIECYIKDEERDAYVRNRSLVKLMDEWGNQLISAGVTREIIGIGNYDNLLIIETNYKTEYYGHDLLKEDFVIPETEQMESFSYQHQGDAFVNGVQVETIDLDRPGYYDIRIEGRNHVREFSITIQPIIELRPEEGTSTSEITIFSSGDLYLNDEPIISGTTVSEPGYYELVVYGENGYSTTRRFAIEAVIENDAGFPISPPLTIRASGSNQTLDGKPYYGGEIYEAGTHLFAVHGEGGYLMTRSFTILPVAEGVTDGGIYDDNISIALNCLAFLNGEAIPKEYTIAESGNYQLILYLDEEPYESIDFTVIIADRKDDNWFLDNIWLLVFAGLGIIGLALAFKKR